MAHSPVDASTPYHDGAKNTIYELLFGDNPGLIQAGTTFPAGSVWTILLAKEPTISDLQKIAVDATQETRVRLLAYHLLRTNGFPVEDKELLAVIVEVGMDNGLDVLASYLDGTARYINYSGKMIIWDAPDQTSLEITQQLFNDSKIIVGKTGPWAGLRRPFPGRGIVRISFLVSDGLYFGEGPVNVLFSDPLAAPALSSATALMQYLTHKTG